MNRTKIAIAGLLILIIQGSCSTVPLTGRKQVNLLPESEMIAMGFTNYSEFKKEAATSSSACLAGGLIEHLSPSCSIGKE